MSEPVDLSAELGAFLDGLEGHQLQLLAERAERRLGCTLEAADPDTRDEVFLDEAKRMYTTDLMDRAVQAGIVRRVGVDDDGQFLYERVIADDAGEVSPA